MATVSVCCAVYRAHEAPNASSLASQLSAALAGLDGDLTVTLNGISDSDAGIPEGVRTVALPDNLGVAPGWNAAAAATRGEVLVFVNDDVVLGPRSVARLVRGLDHDEAGIVGPAGAMWDAASGRHLHAVDATGLAADAVRRCDAISGFLFAVRREIYQAVGGFDEIYAPASFEEVDFSFAVRALGLKAFVLGGLDVGHEWGISARQPPWRTIGWGGKRELLWAIHRRNRTRLRHKWGDTP